MADTGESVIAFEWLREVTRFGDKERRYVIEPGSIDPAMRRGMESASEILAAGETV